MMDAPDPDARAPRVRHPAAAAFDRLVPVPAVLQGALVAIVLRDARGASLGDAQRLTHFPASPLMSLSWFQGAEMGLVPRRAGGWQRFGSQVVVAGSHGEPSVSWADRCGWGGMVCFTPEVARVLFGIDPARVLERIVPADQVLDPSWQPFLRRLAQAADEPAATAVLCDGLGPRWQALNHRAPGTPSLRQVGQHWVERIALQAMQWRGAHGQRQVERRVKAWSGRSLRQSQSLVRADGVFFAARERYEAGQPYEWAGLAHEEGFADQAHMVRVTRRVTGFSPAEFALRFQEDESFWLYRLWV